MKIVIDPGHGGRDTGAVNRAYKIKESSVSLSVALKLQVLLKKTGHKVKLTRSKDIKRSLRERVKTANSWGGDLFISLHCNNFGNPKANGIETFKYSNSLISHKWRKLIHRQLIKAFPNNKDRGVKSANFFVLRKTKMAAVLIEMEFISNNKQAKLLANDKVQAKYAKAISRAIKL